MKYSIISIDYQYDFCKPKGRWYKRRPCHAFIENEFIPFLIENDIKIAEIISDYRLPRPNETESYCVPGSFGYQSAIDPSVKMNNIWIKAMNSPEWVRENGGDPSKPAGVPYQDPAAFSKWLLSTIGTPEQAGEVILIGLTLDCCVLCTAQQLYFRDYKVKVLKEATDVSTPDKVGKLLPPDVDCKDVLFSTSHGMWAKPITWKKLEPELKKSSIIKINLSKEQKKHKMEKIIFEQSFSCYLCLKILNVMSINEMRTWKINPTLDE